MCVKNQIKIEGASTCVYDNRGLNVIARFLKFWEFSLPSFLPFSNVFSVFLGNYIIP